MTSGSVCIEGRSPQCNVLSDIAYPNATHCQNIRPKMTNCGFHTTSHNGYKFPRKAHEYCKSREFRLSAISALLSVIPNFDIEEGDNRDACLLGKVPDDLEAKDAPRRPRRADLVIDPKDGIAASTLYDQIKAFFAACATILAKQNEARGAERFAQASTHWMRHTHASHSIAGGTPIQVAQQNLGHASLATTTIYVTTEKKERLKKMGAFWAQAAERRMGTVADPVAVVPGAGESVDGRGDTT